MLPHTRFWRTAALGLAACLLAPATPAPAHETAGVGPVRLIIGWSDEPAFSGLKNAVEVAVTDLAGKPVTDPGTTLAAEVAFGEERIALSLQPVRDSPGQFRAWLVPTRPGTYSFHITGSVRGQAIDVTSTCSPETFACVSDVSELQFPVKDPSAGQLADGIGRALPRTDQALAAAARAWNIGAGALAMSLVAFAVTIGLRARRGKGA